MIAAVTLGVVAALIARLWPIWAAPTAGVDHWYWRSYVQAARQSRRIPPELPYYLFDEGQWYPPLFPCFLMLWPERALERAARWIGVFGELLRLALLMLGIRALGGHEPVIYGIAGLIYATTPIAASYNVQLNPRWLGALLMDMAFLYLLLIPAAGSPWTLMVPAFLAAAVLLTHKMTAQVFIFTSLAMALLLHEPRFAWVVLLGFPLAWLTSGGFYWKVLRAHWEILRFWTKEWPLLGADPLRESPLYGKPGYTGRSRQFAPGAANVGKRLASLLIGNYAPAVWGAVLLPLVVPAVGLGLRAIYVWLVLVVAFAVLTVVVPWLRGLGFGNLYLYNAAFPAALLLGFGAAGHFHSVNLLIGLSLLANIAVLVRAFRGLRAQTALVLPDAVIEEATRLGPGAWLSYPMQLMEPLAFRARKTVLWGGHGYGFERLHQIFPVLRTDFGDLIRDHGLRFLLVHESYRPDIEALALRKQLVFSSGGFAIFELEPGGAS